MSFTTESGWLASIARHCSGVVLRMDSTALEHDAVKFAQTAVTYDQNGKYNEAVFYYKVCVRL